MNPVQKKYSVLLTDLYQLTMAYGYWKNGVQDREAVFHLFFRKNPFGGGFSVCCGLEDAIAYIEGFRLDEPLWYHHDLPAEQNKEEHAPTRAAG